MIATVSDSLFPPPPNPIHLTPPSTLVRSNDTITAGETTLTVAHARSARARIRLVARLGRPPQDRRTALALDARDFDRVALRREGEQQAPAGRARAPERGAVDVDDEVAVALPGEAAGIAGLAVVPGCATGPDRAAIVAVVGMVIVRTRDIGMIARRWEVVDGLAVTRERGRAHTTKLPSPWK